MLLHKIHIDLETLSRVIGKKVGQDNYAHHPSTQILMAAYAFDDDPVQMWDPDLAPMPADLAAALIDPDYIKYAWFVGFEFSVLSTKLGLPLKIDQWRDPMAHARYLGFPGDLAGAGDALGISTEYMKSKAGKNLIKLFSYPTRAKKPTKKNPAGVPSTFNDWQSHPVEWDQFAKYCEQDVVAERAIEHALDELCPFPESEQKIWLLDQKINDRGIPIDLDFAGKALTLVENERAAILFDLKNMTGCENPNSPAQMKAWLGAEGFSCPSLSKEVVATALTTGDITPDIAEVLGKKQELGGIAFKKLPVIQAWTREDRLRGAFTYHSAHTGRWASRGVQFHNLLKPTKRVQENYDAIVAAIISGEGWPSDIPIIEGVAGTLRAAVRAITGSRFMVADYSSIENRVLAWLAKCPSMLQIFLNGLDPYKSFAAAYFNIPYDQVTKEQRNFCKSPVLGCGFGMGAGRLVGYAAGMGQTLSEETAKLLVTAWRKMHPEVVQYWDDLGNTAMRVVVNHTHLQLGPLRLDGRNPKMLHMTLPSGRAIHYAEPEIGMGKFGKNVLTFMADDKGWRRQEARGSFLVENAVQGIARDVLVNGMFEADATGFPIVLHVHDELVSEVPLISPLTYDLFEQCMTKNPSWGDGIPLKVEGGEMSFYRKG